MDGSRFEEIDIANNNADEQMSQDGDEDFRIHLRLEDMQGMKSEDC